MSDYTFDWSEVWVVGNGPSAARLLPTIPEGASVLCLNDAVFHVNNVRGASRILNVAFFTLDKDWVRIHKSWLATFPCEKHVAIPLKTWPDCGGIPGVRYYGWSHAEGLSDDPGVVATGQNSGYGAINLCALQGSKIIHLIGYDMDPAYNTQYSYWAPFFRHAVPQLNAKGIQVLNHNMGSFIDAFPKVELT